MAVGGGSGGHVTPVVAVIKQLIELNSDVKVHMVCDRKFETQTRGLMANAGTDVKISVVSAGKFRRYSHLTFWQHFTVPHVVWGNITDIGKIGLGFVQSLGILLFNRPDVVFAKGGYVCLPMGLAAWLLRIPLVIHDSDTRPGLTNRVLARFARSIATGSPLKNYNYDPAKSTYIGVPIGSEFKPVDVDRQRDLKLKLGVPVDKKLIVTTGGGLGSKIINDAAVAAAKNHADDSIFWYVVSGKAHFSSAVEQAEGVINIKVIEFVYENMDQVLGAADIVVTRASATFLQELAGLKKTIIAVPARQLGDQIKNARVFDEANAAIVLSDDEVMKEDALADAVNRLVDDNKLAAELAQNLHEFARPNAANDLAKLLISAVKNA